MKMVSDYIVPIGPEGLHILETSKWRTKKPVLHEDKCKRCGKCFLYCPVFSIERSKENVYSICYDYCKGCGICAHECGFNAIEMVPEEER
jgi:pyruvate ferredoxin oxidoreductase delta subunit